jgi:hypothetical protein
MNVLGSGAKVWATSITFVSVRFQESLLHLHKGFESVPSECGGSVVY